MFSWVQRRDDLGVNAFTRVITNGHDCDCSIPTVQRASSVTGHTTTKFIINRIKRHLTYIPILTKRRTIILPITCNTQSLAKIFTTPNYNSAVFFSFFFFTTLVWKVAAGSRTPNNVLILHSKPELGLFQEVAVCFCKNDPLFSDALLLLFPSDVGYKLEWLAKN